LAEVKESTEGRIMSETKRSRVNVSSPFAEVRTAPVSVHGSQVSNQAIEIRDDHGDWQCLNIHSAGYRLVPNSTVNEIAEEILIQVDRINDIIKRLDHGWIDSDNVRRFLKRNYGIGEDPPALNQ